MAEIKFQVDENALQVFGSTEIKANFAETKAALEEMISPYKGAIVDVSNLNESKADLARIRKIERSIDDYRKMVKKYATAPVKAFEDKCNELKAICSEASSAMDAQVKEIERKQKDEKIASLREFFDAQEKKYPDYVSFDQVFDDKWENKTYPVETAQQDILSYLGEVEKDIDIIKSLKSEDEVALLMRYSDTYDLRDVMEYNTILTNRKKQAEEERLIEEERAREELERKQQEAEDRIRAQFGDGIALPFGMPEEEPKQEKELIPTKTVQITFNFKGTPSEIAKFEEKLMGIGIKNYRMIVL